MSIVRRIAPCLWFDDQAEEAAAFYTGIFPNSKVGRVTCYTDAGHEMHRERAGRAMTVAFELDGQPFVALNGGPVFSFSEAISFQVYCATQAEVDYYWERLSAGGDEAAQQCGWLKDRFGVSWQVVPSALLDMLNDADADKARRVAEAMLPMKKLNIDELRRAYGS